MSLPAALQTAAPFDALTDTERATLEAISDVRALAAGETLFEVGDPAPGVYVHIDGVLALEDPMMATLGGDSPVELREAGTLIAKGALIEPLKHRRRCRAVTEARVLLLDRARFQAAFAVGSPFTLKLLDHIVHLTGAEVRALNAAIHSLLHES